MTETLAEAIPAAVEIDGEPTAVYRLYDGDGALLYVGVSGNLPARLAGHAAEKAWWPLVVKKTAVLYGSRGEALMAEDRAIRGESPIHNVAGRRERLQAVEKAAYLERKLASAGRSRKEHAHVFDAAIESWIDEYAEHHKRTHSEALVDLLFAGMLKHYEDLSAAHEVEMAALRAEVALAFAARQPSHAL